MPPTPENRYFYRILSKIVDFRQILYKKRKFYIEFGPDWVGTIPEYVYNLCFAVEPPRRGFFLAKKSISRNFGHGHFSKKSVLVKNSIFESLIWRDVS